MPSSTLLLERISTLIQQTLRDEAARHGLLPVQLQVLHYLARANRYSDLPIAIAEYLGVTRGTVSQTLAVLTRKGLLARHPQGRRIHLHLTPAGTAVVQQGWTSQLETVLDETGNAAMQTGLQHLLRALQHLNQQQAFGICHQCQHFLKEQDGHRCGLTGEVLEDEQIVRLCREWRQADGADRVRPAKWAP